VLLVTIDTLRADRLREQGPMPRLWALARRGALFRQAHTQIPLTLPSHACLLTGRGVSAHGVRDNVGYALRGEIPTVAERFAAAGYDTAAFVGGYPLTRAFGLQRGFDLYDDRMTRAPEGAPAGHTERRATEVVDAAATWISARHNRPFFAWVHLFDPHHPYEAPPPFAGAHPHPYDDEVAYADHCLGQLLDRVAGSGAKPWIAVAADHGESLGDHGEATHGIFLYEATLRIPLVVTPPFAIEPTAIDRPVWLVDLAPTLLEAAGLDGADPGDGRSLLGHIVGTGEAAEPVVPRYLESIHGRHKYGWATLAGFLDWPLKFVDAPEPELYDLERDPDERVNRATEFDLGPFETRLGRLRPASSIDARRPGTTPELERLAALGYVGTSASATEADRIDDRPRPDPKSRVAALPPLERGLTALARGNLAEAVRELGAAFEHDPDNLVTINNLGIVALRRGDAAGAERLFARGLASDPASASLANNLGMARSRLGHPREAADAFSEALAIRPGFTAARFNLALALHRQGLHPESLRELERVREEEADFPDLEATVREVRRALSR